MTIDVKCCILLHLFFSLSFSSVIIYGRMEGEKMAKKSYQRKRKKRMLFLGLTSVMMICAVTFTIGKYWVEIYSKYQEKKELEKELLSLKDKEEKLKVDVGKLQDPDYIARYAREKYLYSKDGEYILKIP